MQCHDFIVFHSTLDSAHLYFIVFHSQQLSVTHWCILHSNQPFTLTLIQSHPFTTTPLALYMSILDFGWLFPLESIALHINFWSPFSTCIFADHRVQSQLSPVLAYSLCLVAGCHVLPCYIQNTKYKKEEKRLSNVSMEGWEKKKKKK